MKLVAGLGNPGARYARTRHNLGFRVADRLAERASVAFGPDRAEAWTARLRWGEEAVIVVKPQTFMNLSGGAVEPLARWYRIEPDSILVVCDDLDLPQGRIRIRRGGGDGGHRGLASVLNALGTEAVPRLRIGIERSAMDPEAWVLAPMEGEEMAFFDDAVESAADAVETWATDGIETSMNRFNSAQMERE
ncbi:MAG: aminoacyl-tRNA hydrolase [Planctomycetota bacterium]|jgi:PTH1 family peptidyl-tRNA hydrolase